MCAIRTRANLFVAAILAALSFSAAACAQGAVQQSGVVTPFHPAAFYGNGVVGDGGTPSAPALDSVGVFNGSTCPVGVSSQTGPGSSSAPYAQFSICQTATRTTLNFLGVNGQATPSVYFNVGGAMYPFPGPGGGTVTGPASSTIGDLACWGSLTGTLLSDCGTSPVASVFGRSGAVTAQSGDYSIGQITGAGSAASANTGASGHVLPFLDVTPFWSAYQCVAVNGGSCGLSPKVGIAYQAVGSEQCCSGENDLYTAVAIDGFAQYQAERLDSGGTGVAANRIVGGYLGAAYMDTGSDPADAGVLMFTTERQTTNHNGMGIEIDYTLTNETALARGISVSPQGLGGVTVGGGYASNNPYSYAGPPTDPGKGSLSVLKDLIAGQHFRGSGGKPTISTCGTSPTNTGTDNAGSVTAGSAVTACTVTFAVAWPSFPVCIVQTNNNASPVTYITTGPSTTSFTVTFSSSYSGGFNYICQGVS